MASRWLFLALVGVCTGLGASAAAQDSEARSRVAIVSSGQESYRNAAASLCTHLEYAGYRCTSIELPPGEDTSGRREAMRRLTAAKPTIVAVAGTSSAGFVLRNVPDAPVVFFMVPNCRDVAFLKEGSPYENRVAGVTTDVAPRQQIDWIVRLCPDAGRIAVLHSARTSRTVASLSAAATERGIVVVPIKTDRDRFPEAVETLNERNCDGVLMIPDAQVYNAATIKRLLLWGLRQKKPVWTFSAKVVKGGALGGIYADSDRTAAQVAELVRRIDRKTEPAKIGLQYPDKVLKAVNERTAAMIGVKLDDRVIRTGTVKFGE